MNERDAIRLQILRMRRVCVEPQAVTLSGGLFDKLGRPRKLCGVAVNFDPELSCGWEVR